MRKVGMDLCEFKKQHYLITVDYYSNFIEVDRLHTTTSENVQVTILKTRNSQHSYIRYWPTIFESQIPCILVNMPI